MPKRQSLAFLRVNDKVEDRSMYTGTGVVVYLAGQQATVQFDCGAEETIDTDVFRYYDKRHWII
jgi:hypothetical protein